MTRLYLAAALLAAVAGAGYWLHHTSFNAGVDSQKVANAEAIADANARAVQDWKDAVREQAAADAALRDWDHAADQATAVALRDIAARYERLAKQPPPPGRCELSPDWLRVFNEAH